MNFVSGGRVTVNGGHEGRCVERVREREREKEKKKINVEKFV